LVDKETVTRLPSALKPLSDEQGANAAVALLLKPNAGDFEMFLVKRAIRAGDVWSGQMALPGGKREPQDGDLTATIIRETWEETGIDLCKSRFLGVLDAVYPVPRRDVLVLPFVVLLENDPKITLNHGELASCLWVSYEEIQQGAGKTFVPNVGEVPALLLHNAVVWGMTYRILRAFTHTVEALKPR
jgi:8-oxo-dGTP pyrophosphatase MutT (NUDIX family)